MNDLLIEKFQTSSFKIKINWYYDEDNEGALESREDFKENFGELELKFIKK